MPARPRTLSEFESKRRLAAAGVPTVPERLAATPEEAAAAAAALGFPVVVKLCGPAIAHKTERGLVRLDVPDAAAVRAAAAELLAAARAEDGPVDILVSAMVRGRRELIAGGTRDPTFGPCVMVGIGGIFAEALHDVVFRLAPLEPADAAEMLEDLEHPAWLDALRGEPPVDRARLAALLVALGDLMAADASIVSIDVNPLVVAGGEPIAVDALVEIATG